MKGILFKPDMIQAIVEGRKTQTRRLGGLGVINDHQPDCWRLSPANTTSPPFRFCDNREDIPHNERYFPIECKPRYKVGETVYIKEAWCPLASPAYGIIQGTMPTVYKQEMDVGGATLPKEFKWKSPLFMPEWAARHFIKILAVRAERLQEISKADIRAEGFDGDYTKIGYYYVFGQAWNWINPKYPWGSNPWVFVYDFEFVKDMK